MEQKRSEIVYQERNAPKKAVVRSDGALYVLLLLLVFGAIERFAAYEKTDAKPAQRTYRGGKEKTTAVWYTDVGERYVLLLNATDALKEKLSEAIHVED